MTALRTLLLCLALMILAVPAAHARPAPETVVQDDALFLHGSEEEIQMGLRQARDIGIRRVRLTAGWSVIAPAPTLETVPEGDLADPAAYPRDHWRNLDRAVRLTVEAGMRPMIDIAFWAPRWAINGQPGETTRLRTNIDAAQYARFAEAVARRYAGGYVPNRSLASAIAPAAERRPDANLLESLFGRRKPPVALPPLAQEKALPAVDLFTIWNEPNHSGFLQPQWRREGGRYVPHSPHLYRAMVYAAYPAIKRAAPDSRVLIGGTASGGSSTAGRSGVPPLLFLRAFACVDERLRPVRSGPCGNFERIPGDGWSHHPYSLRTLPDAQPEDTDKLPVASTPRLMRTLRKLVAGGRIEAANATVYMTEYGYETNPPDPKAVFSPRQQGRLLAWAEYLATRDPGVVMWPQFQLRDRPGDPAGPKMRPYGDWQTGLLNADGTPKPAYHEYRTPAFAACRRSGKRRWIEVWGRVRGADEASSVQLQVRTRGAVAAAAAAGWRTVPGGIRPRLRGFRAAQAQESSPGAAITRFIPWRRGLQVRLQWNGDGAQASAGAALTARPCPAAKSRRR
ncbi:MAG: hypothetical protein KY463_05015 [Actinobacteria bacterium]|nr:hypothetical protein [Actinomycetota bacterium]